MGLRYRFGFAGLTLGDRWCLCAPRWKEAREAAHALAGGFARFKRMGVESLRVRRSQTFRHDRYCHTAGSLADAIRKISS